MRPAVNTADLATRACKRGHVGQYVLRGDGSSACKSCSRISTNRHRGSEEARTLKLREHSVERIAELELSISKLRVQLQLAETEYDFLTKTLAILDTAK